jgi:hypothetical protein
MFVEKSMIHDEIKSRIIGLTQDQSKLNDEISKNMGYIMISQTPRDICEEYIIIEHLIQNTVNKRRKKAVKDKQQLIDKYRNIVDDVKRVIKLNNLKDQLVSLDNTMYNTTTYIKTQIDVICDILLREKLIQLIINDDPEITTPIPNTYEFTSNGHFASNIAEIHPLIITRLVNDYWDNFNEFTVVQIIGIFAGFTTIRVADEYKSNLSDIVDKFVYYRMKEATDMCIKYGETEHNCGLYTGIDYDTIVQYDIINLSMKWCECTDETECKQVIQNDVANMSISVGDFTKAMLKIVTISNEFINIYETMGNTQVLHKLSSIEPMILKYIMTSQSLYI